MINPDLERRYADCVALVEEWGNFLDLVNRALRQSESINPQNEQVFLATKARIAMLHDSLMDSLRTDKATGNKMLEIVNRAITLKALAKASEPEQKKTESEWHECFLLLNETVSSLNEERIKLADVNEFTHKMGKVKEGILAFIGKMVTSLIFKLVATLVVIIAVVVCIQIFGIYNYDNLRDVQAVRPVVKTYLSTMRLVGFDMAYYEVGDVSAKLTAPDGFQVKSDVGDINAERAANVFAGWNQYNNNKLGDLLKAARGYDRLTFTRNDGQGSPCQAYVFWYRKTADARAAAREAKVNIPPTVAVEHRANVLVLIQSQDADSREKVRTGSVRKL
ncbi:hypothetical protein GC173_17780 [bacterium]|nr:hypothetical protein [bacterium]